MKPQVMLALAALLPACGGGSSVATRRPLPSPTAAPSPRPTVAPSPSPTLAPAPMLTLAAPQELGFPDEPFRKDEPAAAAPRAFVPPTVQRFQLESGIDVFLVERHTIPTVTVRLAFEGGGIEDPPGQEGLISLCVSLMTDGTEKLDKLAFEAALADLASSIGSEAGADWQTFSMSALTRNLEPTLDLFVDSLLHPGMRQDEFERNTRRRIEALRAVRGSVGGVAGRVQSSVIYGPRHPHGRIITEAAVGKYSLDACKAHAKTLHPRGARLFVAGDITAEQVKASIGARLASFTGSSKAAKAKVPGAPAPRPGKIFFVDVPNAPQSVIALMHVGPARTAPDYAQTMLMASVLGVGFTSRINMNIREQKGYAYGARGGFDYTRKFGTFTAGGSIRTDATVEAVKEIFAEIDKMQKGGPDESELLREKTGTVLALPARFETAGATLGTFEGLTYFGLPLDYYASYIPKVQAVTVKAAAAAAKKYLKPKELRVLVVGDAKAVLPGLRELAQKGLLGKGGITLLDADGNVVPEQPAATKKPPETVPPPG
ncbi:MAG: insulinase family protein [Deltaproteobacteria bacterium]|nr:insulinase family protein [Deltaproteobacteria bacterium]